ncbi:MAG: hypothetical protein QXH27_01630 [Candidatus Micrarchaeia archaeon]
MPLVLKPVRKGPPQPSARSMLHRLPLSELRLQIRTRETYLEGSASRIRERRERVARLKGNVEALQKQKERREQEITQKLRILKHFFPKQDKETVRKTEEQLSRVDWSQLPELLRRTDILALIGEPLPEVVGWFGNFFKTFTSRSRDQTELEGRCNLVVMEMQGLAESRRNSGMDHQAAAEQLRVESPLKEAKKQLAVEERALEKEEGMAKRIEGELAELKRVVRRKVIARAMAAGVLAAGLAAGGVTAFMKWHWRTPSKIEIPTAEPEKRFTTEKIAPPPTVRSQTTAAPKPTVKQKTPVGEKSIQEKKRQKKGKQPGVKKKKQKGKKKQKTGWLDTEPYAEGPA